MAPTQTPQEMTTLPGLDQTTICFAHPAYRLAGAYEPGPGERVLTATNADELVAALPETDVLVVSGLWRNEYLERAPRLRFVQSVSAGTDQFARDAFQARGVRLASAQGVNERAVSEHAMALMLGLTRHLPQAVENKAARHWRGMIADPSQRQDELAGKTLLIVGLGRIGARLARLASAFEMEVVGVRRSPVREGDAVAEIVPPDGLIRALEQADVVALTCPLTPETERLIRAEHFAAMKPSALLVNVARGKVVDEPALIDALQSGRIAGAGLDCTVEEPLPAGSPLWSLPNVLITPHTAGETRRYEANVVELLRDNLGRLDRGEALRNAIV
jgi:D-2-hydroxyacid dehydrogenase (NADP+)